MRTKSFIVVALVLSGTAAGVSFVLLLQELQAPTIKMVATTPPASLTDTITVDTPLPLSTIISPLTITGKARGSWYFEASAPITLQDASGTIIASAHLTAQGDWMTTNYVPFTTTLTFTKPATSTVGTLIFKTTTPPATPQRTQCSRYLCDYSKTYGKN